jgi:2-polyprenyl-3-methyl-5-hydroxy-6-metoxy-1,4-benzoquinol methylase
LNESTNINDNFFQGQYKEVWRKLIPPGLSEAECSFIEDVAHLQPSDSVLDLMCGYGRHTLELARRGYRITAVDNLSQYIDEINSVAAVAQLSIEAIANGAIDITLHHQYKAILCMGNSFAFFDKKEALILLKKIAAHLLPNGVFIINTWMIAEIAIRHFQEREWYQVDDYKYLLHYRFHFQPNRIESEHTLIASDGTIEVIQGVDYVLTLDEMESLFQEAGLQLRDIYSTPKKRPFKMGDNKAYLVVGKA